MCQISFLCKSFLTKWAAEWFLSCMDPHVFYQWLTQTKPCFTHWAAVRLLSCVNSHVPGQNSPPDEGFWADRAADWLLSCVGSHVCAQTCALCESCSTNGTVKGFLPCVHSDMLHNISFVNKLYLTDWTSEGPFPWMNRKQKKKKSPEGLCVKCFMFRAVQGLLGSVTVFSTFRNTVVSQSF